MTDRTPTARLSHLVPGRRRVGASRRTLPAVIRTLPAVILTTFAVVCTAGCQQQIQELRERYETDTPDGLDLDIQQQTDASPDAESGDIPDTAAPELDTTVADGSADGGDVLLADVPPRVPSTSSIYALLATECSPCHTDRAEGGLLLLDDGGLEARLLSPSLQLPSMPRIQPGEPDSSYLFLKVTGQHVDAGGLGEPMPLGTPLSAGDTELLRRWIEAGSADEGATAP